MLFYVYLLCCFKCFLHLPISSVFSVRFRSSCTLKRLFWWKCRRKLNDAKVNLAEAENQCLLRRRINMSQCAVKTRCTFCLFGFNVHICQLWIRVTPWDYKMGLVITKTLNLQTDLLFKALLSTTAPVGYLLNAEGSIPPTDTHNLLFIGWLRFRCACFPPDSQMRVRCCFWFLSASDWRMSVLGEGKSSAWTFHLLLSPNMQNIDAWETSSNVCSCSGRRGFLICLFLSSRWSLWKLAPSSGPSLVVSPIFIW